MCGNAFYDLVPTIKYTAMDSLVSGLTEHYKFIKNITTFVILRFDPSISTQYIFFYKYGERRSRKASVIIYSVKVAFYDDSMICELLKLCHVTSAC